MALKTGVAGFAGGFCPGGIEPPGVMLHSFSVKLVAMAILILMSRVQLPALPAS